MSSLLSFLPSSVITESLKDLSEQKVGGEAVHAREDEVANQVDNMLSFRPHILPQPLRGSRSAR
jgi:hypothetical protein